MILLFFKVCSDLEKINKKCLILKLHRCKVFRLADSLYENRDAFQIFLNHAEIFELSP